LQSHHHSDVAAAYEHLNGGFDPGQLQDLLEHIGFAPSLCEVTSRERKKPHFHVISAFAQRPTTTRSAAMRARTPARAS
jgi:ArsR family transcriptional regulator